MELFQPCMLTEGYSTCCRNHCTFTSAHKENTSHILSLTAKSHSRETSTSIEANVRTKLNVLVNVTHRVDLSHSQPPWHIRYLYLGFLCLCKMERRDWYLSAVSGRTDLWYFNNTSLCPWVCLDADHSEVHVQWLWCGTNRIGCRCAENQSSRITDLLPSHITIRITVARQSPGWVFRQSRKLLKACSVWAKHWKSIKWHD